MFPSNFFISADTFNLRELLADMIYPAGKDRRQQLEREANTDILTGLANRRLFDQIEENSRLDSSLSVIIFDVNNFGQVNKIKSQVVGDEYLKSIGDSFRAVSASVKSLCPAAGPYPIAIRLGGDEFLVVIKSEIAELYLRLLEKAVGDTEFTGIDKKSGQEVTVTCSITGSIGDNYYIACDDLQTKKNNRKASAATK